MSGFHSQQTTADGLHIITRFNYLNTTDRDAFTYTAADVGGVARVGSVAPYSFYILTNHNPPTWDSLSGSGGGSSSGSVTGVPVTYSAEAMNWKVHISNVLQGGANAPVRYANTQLGDEILNPEVMHTFGTAVAANPIITAISGSTVTAGTSDLSPLYIISNITSTSQRPSEWDNVTVYPGKQAVEPTFFYPINIEHETTLNNIQFEFGHLGTTGQTSPNFYEYVELRLWIQDANGDINPASGNYVSVVDLDPSTVPAPLSSIMPMALDVASQLSAVTIPAATLGITGNLEPQTALLEVKFGIGTVTGTNGVSTVKNISLNNVVGGSAGTFAVSSGNYTVADVFNSGRDSVASSGTGAAFSITTTLTGSNITSVTITATSPGSGYSKYAKFTVSASQLGGGTGEITFTIDAFTDPEPEANFNGYVIRNPILNGSSISAVGSGGSGGAHAHSIDDLSDVDTTTNAPSQNQVLVWDSNSSPGKWVPGNQTSATGTIVGDRIEDTTLSSAARLIAESASVSGSEQLLLTGNIIPNVDSVYNLGSSAKKFNELHPLTIHIGTGEISVDADGDLTNNQAKIAKELKSTDSIVLDVSDASNFELNNVTATFMQSAIGSVGTIPFGSTTDPIVDGIITDIEIYYSEEAFGVYSIDAANETITNVGPAPHRSSSSFVPVVKVTMNAWNGASSDAPTHINIMAVPIVNDQLTVSTGDLGSTAVMMRAKLDSSIVSSGGTVTTKLISKVVQNAAMNESGDAPLYLIDSAFINELSNKTLLWMVTPAKIADPAAATSELTLATTPAANAGETVIVEFGYAAEKFKYTVTFDAGNGAAPTQWTSTVTNGALSGSMSGTFGQTTTNTATIYKNDAGGSAKSNATLFTEIANLFNPSTNTTNGLNASYVTFASNGSSTITFTAAKLMPFGPMKINLAGTSPFFTSSEDTQTTPQPDMTPYQSSATPPVAQHFGIVRVSNPINIPEVRETYFEKNVRTPKVSTNKICMSTKKDKTDPTYEYRDDHASIDFNSPSHGVKSMGTYTIQNRLNQSQLNDIADIAGAISDIYANTLLHGIQQAEVHRFPTWEFFGFFNEAKAMSVTYSSAIDQPDGFHTAAGFNGAEGPIPALGIVQHSITEAMLTATYRDAQAMEWSPQDILLNPVRKKTIHIGSSAADKQEIVFNDEYYMNVDGGGGFNLGLLPKIDSSNFDPTTEPTYTKTYTNRPILSLFGGQNATPNSGVIINPFMTKDPDQSSDNCRELENIDSVNRDTVLTVNCPSEDTNMDSLLLLEKEFNSDSGTVTANEEVIQDYAIHFHTQSGNIKTLGSRVTLHSTAARPTTLTGTVSLVNNTGLQGEYVQKVRTAASGLTAVLTGNKKKHEMSGGLQLGDPATSSLTMAAGDNGMMGVDANFEPYILREHGYVHLSKQLYLMMDASTNISPCRVGTVMVDSQNAGALTLTLNSNPSSGFCWDMGDVVTIHNTSSDAASVITVNTQDQSGGGQTLGNTTIFRVSSANAVLSASFTIAAGKTAVITCSRVNSTTAGTWEYFTYYVY